MNRSDSIKRFLAKYKFTLIIYFIITVSLLAGALFAKITRDKCHALRARESSLHRLSDLLLRTSNNLANEAMRYTAFGESEALSRYSELLGFRSRVIDDIRTAGISGEEQQQLTLAIGKSGDMIEIDKRAMRLAAEANGVARNLPPEIIKVRLPEGEKSLSPVQKRTVAHHILHDDAYNNIRIAFMYHIAGFQRLMQEGLGKEISRAEREIYLSLYLMMVVAGFVPVLLVADLLKRYRAEGALWRSEEFTKNILGSIGEGLVVIDRSYRILSANRAYCDHMKMPVGDVIGRHCYRVSHNTSVPCFDAGEECAVKRVLESGESSAIVHAHKDGTGDTVFVEINAYPLRDESGEVTAAIESVRDITEKRKLESQLRQAQKMEAIGQLAGGVAHDFSNMLTAIMGFGSLLRMNIEKESPLLPYIEQILASTQKAGELTQNLLTFSRKQVIEPRPIRLNDAVRTVEKLLLRLIGESIRVSIELADDPIILADPGQVEQALMNLATNAKDAMPDGGLLSIETKVVRLDEEYIKAYPYIEPGTYAVLTVSDTGSGIDEKIKERVFEPFFTTKEVGQGTGLGLSMVYGMVKQHNGYINVYSEQNRGTTFKIYLPVIEAEVENVQFKTLPPPKGGSETILIAEDEADVRKAIREILESFGYKVIEAMDGVNAIEVFAANRDRIQLLLLDLIMPNKNGKEAYEEIKKLNPKVKALFMTGYAASIIHKQGILETGLDLIAKPIAPYGLLRKVRKVLDKPA